MASQQMYWTLRCVVTNGAAGAILYLLSYLLTYLLTYLGHAVAQLVEALRYKPEG